MLGAQRASALPRPASSTGGGPVSTPRRPSDRTRSRRRTRDTPAAHLSGGNIQRMILARAFSHRDPVPHPAQPDPGPRHPARPSSSTTGPARPRERDCAVLLISEDLDELTISATASSSSTPAASSASAPAATTTSTNSATSWPVSEDGMTDHHRHVHHPAATGDTEPRPRGAGRPSARSCPTSLAVLLAFVVCGHRHRRPRTLPVRGLPRHPDDVVQVRLRVHRDGAQVGAARAARPGVHDPARRRQVQHRWRGTAARRCHRGGRGRHPLCRPAPMSSCSRSSSSAGVLAGGVFAWIAAWLMDRFGINEILSTVLLNFVSFGIVDYVASGCGATRPPAPRRPPDRRRRPAAPRRAAADAPRRAAGRCSSPLATVVVMRRSVPGYELRAVGATPGPPGPRHPDRPRRGRSLVVGGALAGLAGAIEVAGVHGKLIEGMQSNYLLLGIIIGLIARGNAARGALRRLRHRRARGRLQRHAAHRRRAERDGAHRRGPDPAVPALLRRRRSPV